MRHAVRVKPGIRFWICHEVEVQPARADKSEAGPRIGCEQQVDYRPAHQDILGPARNARAVTRRDRVDVARG